MVMQVTVHEAETNFSKLIAAVEAGEEVVISRKNKPVARLVREEKTLEERINPLDGLGCGRGVFSDEAIDYLTDNKKLDSEIERDFEEAVAKDIL